MSRNEIVGVVVLGDIGRSPRMQYHAYSLHHTGFKVKVLGYNESTCSSSLLNGVNIVNVKQPPTFAFSQLFQFIFKVLWNAVVLLYLLFLNGKFNILLVQNPPAIPALAVCWLYCRCTGGKLIIDWHNYAYSILALSTGSNHILTRISKVFEKYIGQLADANLCVSKSMKDDLKTNWNIKATTLYDKPGPIFKPSITEKEKSKLFDKLSLRYSEFELLRSDKPIGLLVSSTSWTEDEDFSILLDALLDYDNTVNDALPFLLCVITGKGPLKNYYQEKMKRCNLSKVKVVTPWLEPEDYPLLLASADLGVCLHTSSSGLDLPMKVIDMFGSSLPVCAYEYPCLSELVRHDINGLIFSSSKQLSLNLKLWFRNFPQDLERHVRLRKNIAEFQKVNWHDNWVKNALPMF